MGRFDTRTITGNRFDVVPSIDEIIGGVAFRPKTDIPKEKQETEKFLNLPWHTQVLARESTTSPFIGKDFPSVTGTTAKGVGEIAKVVTREIVKPFISLKELPRVLITGKAENKPVVFPIIGETPSYFYQAEKRAHRIISGDQPLWHALWPFIEVPLDMIAVSELLQSGVKISKRTLSTINKLQSGEMMADDLLKSAGKEIGDKWKILSGKKKRVKVKRVPTPEVEIPVKIKVPITGVPEEVFEIPIEVSRARINLKTQKNIISNATKIVEANPTSKIALDQSRKLFKRVAESLATGEIIPEDIIPILKKYNIRPEQFAQQYIETISMAGRELNQLSQLSKRIQKILPDTPELKTIFDTFRQAEPASFGTWGWMKRAWLRVENWRRASMVSQLATSARNAISQSVRYGLDIIDEGLTGAMEIMTGVRPPKEAMAPFFESFASIWRQLTPGGRKSLINVLDEFPLESARLFRTPVTDIVLLDKYSKVINTANSFQEFFFRRLVMDAKITSAATRLGIDDLKNLPVEEISKAVDKALEITFASKPGGALGAVTNMYREMPLLYTFSNPFPRFWANSIKFLWDFSPGGYTKLLNPKFLKQLISNNPKEAYSALVKATVGTAMIGGGMAIRNSEYAGEKWYQVRPDPQNNPKLQIDLRAFAPFSTYLFIAEAISNPDNLTGTDWLQGAIGINRIAGTGLVIVDIVRSGTPEGTVKMLKEFISTWVSGFTVPFRTFKDFMGHFSKEERIIRNTRENFYGPIIDPIPVVSQILPPYTPITRGEPLEREEPALRQITGLTVRTKTFFEQELDRLGVERWRIYPRTGIRELDRLIAEEVGGIAEQKGKDMEKSAAYQRLNEDQKKEVILELFSNLRRVGKEKVLRKRKDLLEQLREKEESKEIKQNSPATNRFNI